ncbi:hypothetical protein CIB93_02135 [Streptomyces sp. WZ.A104]|uniref:Lipoprotein n=1 Tax=Streptomyces durocortorensis TaxID=2811104 RepID=A0ABY9VZQ6_9ACTN|nr:MULTISPECIES: hypothetical protein [Streptomyces]PCG87521.1 hypothetical protein CIB93_02135 [Streptomyces sp. WZ.A104]WNF29063.1 hypothetical protein RI138_20765 [Streptomyces durocortorensis]
MSKRRLRSSTVVLGGMGLLALTISSCGSEPDRRCADRMTRETLPSYECRGSGGGSGGSGGSGGGTGRGSYYYGGDSSDGKVQGGSFDKSAVDRGGFGCARSGGG